MISVDVIGANELKLKLGRFERGVARRRVLLGRIGQYLRRAFTTRMTQGRGPDGNMLPPVQRWTRLVSGYNPSAKVLHRTGTLRRAIGPLSVSDSQLIFGFHGEQRKIALAQTLGRAGRIKVAESVMAKANARQLRRFSKKGKGRGFKGSIGISRAGKPYVRLQRNDGSWFTKHIDGGTISVKPRPRRFFYLGRQDIREIRKLSEQYVAALANAR